jgi:hypothetical protein
MKIALNNIDVVKELTVIILMKREDHASKFKEIILNGNSVLKILLFYKNGNNTLLN